MEPWNPVPEAFDALLAFLPDFESPDAAWAGTWGGGQRDERGVIQMPYFERSDRLQAFVSAVYSYEWVQSGFAWMDWDGARDFVEHPERIQAADITTLRRLLTTHVRADRFNEGHLASMTRSGQLLAILRRLRELRPG